jgi:hypothetical protein
MTNETKTDAYWKIHAKIAALKKEYLGALDNATDRGDSFLAKEQLNSIVEFYKKELLIYEYIIGLIVNDTKI